MKSCSTFGSFDSAGCSQRSFCSTFATMLRWSSVAPFDTPVVPPVYCRNATSSGEIARVLSGLPLPAAIAALNCTACGNE